MALIYFWNKQLIVGIETLFWIRSMPVQLLCVGQCLYRLSVDPGEANHSH